MWYPATVTSAPASEPVTLTEAKLQTRVESSDEDTYLTGLIKAARAHVESMCGIRIITQTVTVKCDLFEDFAHFPVAPVSSVSSVAYVDTAGAAQTLSSNVYEVRNDGLTCGIVLKYGQSWPSIQDGSRITVTAIAGASAAPEEIKQAILLLIAHWFLNREAVGPSDMAPVPMAVDALLANWRQFTF